MEKEEDAIQDCVYHSYLRDLLMVASDFVFWHEFKQQITEQLFIKYLHSYRTRKNTIKAIEKPACVSPVVSLPMATHCS